MPMHDWTRVSSGTYHNFHCRWQAALCDALNTGGLPGGYFAMMEQHLDGPIPDVLAIELPNAPAEPASGSGGLAVATAPPKTRFVVRTEAGAYARRARRVTVRDELGRVVSVIEIVSPGNKDTPNAIRAFTTKLVELLYRGVNLVVVDPFPPSARDPQGMHKAIWDGIGSEPFELPSDKRLTAAGYCAEALTGYVEPFAVGDVVPDVPLFVSGEVYVPCPLEASYQATWAVMPAPIRRLIEPAAGTNP
ncbi:MAG TPA: DUF4058 family protein [Gemmata sp.]